MSNIPEDLRETAGHLIANYGCDDDLLFGAIAAALLAEREAQRERDAKIAEAATAPRKARLRDATVYQPIADRKFIASAIRSNTAAGTPTPQDET